VAGSRRVKTTGSTLTTVDGIGPVLAGRILGRTDRKIAEGKTRNEAQRCCA
jgi:hypothetical protein